MLCCFLVANLVNAAPGIPARQEISREEIVSEFSRAVPARWGESIRGVRTKFITDKKLIALTFDACGSRGDGCDWRLIRFLQKERVPATLFISGRWIDAHPSDFARLAKIKLFEIENHGAEHKPCSVNGKSVYGLSGTRSAGEVYDEVEGNARKIQRLIGRKPLFYRSGTAYYDEVAVAIVRRLGYEVAGFSVLGDAGATYHPKQVVAALLSARPGSIVILHMNHPERWTGEGVIAALPRLKKKGFGFVRLSECHFAKI